METRKGEGGGRHGGNDIFVYYLHILQPHCIFCIALILYLNPDRFDAVIPDIAGSK